MLKRALLLLFPLLCFGVHQAWACSCAPLPNPKEMFDLSDVVFMGTVVDTETVETTDDWPLKKAEFLVRGFWKGEVGQDYEVFTYVFPAGCGFSFFPETKYLVYAGFRQGQPLTHQCTRTRRLENAEEDLEFLGPPMTVPVAERSWGSLKSLY
jgi:hypothetical protein